MNTPKYITLLVEEINDASLKDNDNNQVIREGNAILRYYERDMFNLFRPIYNRYIRGKTITISNGSETKVFISKSTFFHTFFHKYVNTNLPLLNIPNDIKGEIFEYIRYAALLDNDIETLENMNKIDGYLDKHIKTNDDMMRRVNSSEINYDMSDIERMQKALYTMLMTKNHTFIINDDALLDEIRDNKKCVDIIRYINSNNIYYMKGKHVRIEKIKKDLVSIRKILHKGFIKYE